MTVLSYFVETNVALFLTMLVLIAVRTSIACVIKPPAPRTDVHLLRGVLIMASSFPLLTAAISWFGIEPTLFNVTTEFDTTLGSWIHWTRQQQGADAFIWLLMSSSFAIGLVTIAMNVRGLWHINRLSRITRRYGLVSFRQGPASLSPCSYLEPSGITVLLPQGLGHTNRHNVILHEFMHARHYDLMWNWMILFARCLYVLNPAFWIWRTIHWHQCEVACDEAVVAHPKVSLQDYSRSLLGVATSFSNHSASTHAGAMFIGGTKLRNAGLKWRIRHLLELKDQPPARSWLPVCFLAILLTNLFLATGQITVRPWSVSALTNDTNINLVRMAAQRRDRAYGLVLAY